ncbi:MAG: DEAD/DEAH box helicase family protein [Acidimicrobiales bacterium]
MSAAVLFETGQGVRWRGRRWRVLGEETNGLLTLVGVEAVNRDQVATPLVALESEAIVPDTVPLPVLDVAATDRARWRALHQAFSITMAGGREQMVGLDWGAVTVEPYQLVPLMRVARSIRPRLLVADDTGLGKTAEAGIVLRWLAQRHQAGRVLIVTRAAPEPERWRQEMWAKFGFRFDILASGSDFAERRRRSPTLNVFAQQPRLIVSMTLAARQVLLDELRRCPSPFDVVIVDEAHHLAERGSSTKRLALLGRAVAAKCTEGSQLLLTATPHDGKTESFLSLLRLLDPLVEANPGEVPVDLASHLVVRRLKSEVTLAGGRRFVTPEIHLVSTLADATRQEQAVDRPLDEYLRWLADEEVRYAEPAPPRRRRAASSWPASIASGSAPRSPPCGPPCAAAWACPPPPRTTTRRSRSPTPTPPTPRTRCSTPGRPPGRPRPPSRDPKSTWPLASSKRPTPCRPARTPVAGGSKPWATAWSGCGSRLGCGLSSDQP